MAEEMMDQRTLIGQRLREERIRLGLNQDQLGITPQSQRKYEKGLHTPPADYLQNFAELGADVLYVVTGQRVSGVMDSDEASLVSAFRSAPTLLKKAAFAVLKAEKALEVPD